MKSLEVLPLRTGNRTRLIAVQALIAAVYAAMSLALPMLSYGAVQVRVSEALTLLPVFSPQCILGVTMGCFLANLIGAFLSVNTLGFLDVAVGTAATLAAAVLTSALGHIRFRKLPVLASLPPVVVNGLVIGAEIMYVTTGGLDLRVFFLSGLSVAAGEMVACCGFGLTMVWFLEKRGLAEKFVVK
jgi:uncharacterized membrane protein